MRTGFSKSEDPEAFEQTVQVLSCLALNRAFALLVFCYLCGVQLTFDRRTMRKHEGKDPKGVLISSTNFSPDRRVHTDAYGIETTSAAGWPCNCVKGGYPEASARELLDVLVEAKGSHGSRPTASKGATARESSLPKFRWLTMGPKKIPLVHRLLATCASTVVDLEVDGKYKIGRCASSWHRVIPPAAYVVGDEERRCRGTRGRGG